MPADVLFGDSDSLSPVLVWIYGGGPAAREVIVEVKSRKPFVKGSKGSNKGGFLQLLELSTESFQSSNPKTDKFIKCSNPKDRKTHAELLVQPLEVPEVFGKTQPKQNVFIESAPLCRLCH